MKYALHTLLALVLAPTVVLAQADCEPQPGSQPEAPMPESQEDLAGGLPMPQRTDEKRPDIDEPAPFGECDDGAAPEVLNGTFVAPRRGREEADPGVMAGICEDLGDWKGAAQEHERSGNWSKAARNWDRLANDLSKMGLRKEAGDAAKRRFEADKKATNDRVRKAQEAVATLQRALYADPGDEDLKRRLEMALKELDEATRMWKAVRAAEREERRRAEAQAADAAKKAKEARKRAAEEAKKTEEARKEAAEDTKRAEEAREKALEEAKRIAAQGPVRNIADLYRRLQGGDRNRRILFEGDGNSTTACGDAPDKVEDFVNNTIEKWYDPDRKRVVRRVRVQGVWWIEEVMLQGPWVIGARQ